MLGSFENPSSLHWLITRDKDRQETKTQNTKSLRALSISSMRREGAKETWARGQWKGLLWTRDPVSFVYISWRVENHSVDTRELDLP